MGTALHGSLKAKFKQGAKDYSVGNHPLWELFRMAYQMKHRPFVAGGVALGLGYGWSLMRHAEVPLSSELVDFVQREQMHRLRKIFSGKPREKEGNISAAPAMAALKRSGTSSGAGEQNR
jgi:hypothetical protein